jgi:hypothetical protein
LASYSLQNAQYPIDEECHGQEVEGEAQGEAVEVEGHSAVCIEVGSVEEDCLGC